jgi:branched-chain amino acid aminotransferase
MPIRININGVITPAEDAKIPVLDHGLLFGDSVYETLRTYGGKPFLFARHFARLEHSAQGIDLKLPWTKSKTFEEILRTLLPGECRVRLMITRGAGALEADTETCTDPAAIIIVVPLIAQPERIYEEGVDVVISSVRRSTRFAEIKTGSLIHQVLARREAKLKGAYEAILLTADDKLSDGITSNIYMVQGGKLLTPGRDAGIVAGITRGVVLDLAREMGLQVVEGFFGVSEIANADEMFLTSTTREVVPIARVDGKPVGTGKPGPVSLMLLRGYRSAIGRLVAAEE